MEHPPDEVVIILDRYKLRQNAFSTVGKRNIVANVEAHYARRGQESQTAHLKSAEQRAVPGCEFYVPWAETITGLTVNVYTIQDRLTCFVGQADITTQYFGFEPTKLELYIKNCAENVGKIYLSVLVRQIFLDKGANFTTHSPQTRLRVLEPVIEEQPGSYYAPAPNGFRFNRLSRPINWERLRCVNLRRVAENADVSSLMSVLDDVLTGDVGDEEIDPKLEHALKVAQFTAQYLSAGNRLLQSKKSAIERGVATFEEEEDRVNYQLSKLRAKVRAQQREFDDLDALEMKYSKLLRHCDPKLAKAHRKEERRHFMRAAYEMEKTDRHNDHKNKRDQRNISKEVYHKDDSSVGGSLGAEDSSRAEIEHVYTETTTHYKFSERVEYDSDDENNSSCKKEDASSESIIKTAPKLLSLRQPPKEEAFRRFHVIKKPDEPYDDVVKWENAKRVPHNTYTQPVEDKIESTMVDKQGVEVDAIGLQRIPAQPTQGFSGTFASSTGMSVDSLLRTAASDVTADGRGAYSPRTTYECTANPEVATGKNYEPVEDVNKWVSAAANPKLVEEDVAGSIAADAPQEDEVVAFKAMDSLNVTPKKEDRLSPLDESIAEPLVDEIDAMIPHTRRKESDVYLNASADASMEVTELSDIDYSREHIRHIADSVHRKVPTSNASTVIDAPSSTTDTKKKEPIVVIHDSFEEPSGRPKARSTAAERKAKADKLSLEMQEHSDMFDHPMETLEDLEPQNTIVAFAPDVSEVIIQHEYSPDDTSVGKSADMDDSEPFSADATAFSEDRLDQSETGDILSPLGGVGRAMLRKRTDGGNEDEDDRVLMGTATLHQYDATGILSLDSEVGNNSSSQLDMSEDADLSPASFSAPVHDPPVPPSMMRSSVDSAVEEGGAFHLLSTADTETAASGNNLTQSFGDESSELQISQGFVDNLASRYLNPDMLGTGVVADEGDESQLGVEEGADEEREEEDLDIVKWLPGRASLDLIETAMAIDAYVSSIRVEAEYLLSSKVQKIHIRYNFLDATSSSSTSLNINVRSSTSSMSMNFGAHMEFDRKGYKLLTEEIADEGDELALQIIVFGECQQSDDEDDVEDKVIGIATVNLWFMIEDSCAIVLQEVDVMDVDNNTAIGSLVVDVRGHHCLMECT